MSRIPTNGQPAGGLFADRLAALVAERQSQLVLGLDPDPMRLWPEAEAAATSFEATAEAPRVASRVLTVTTVPSWPPLAEAPRGAGLRAAARVAEHCRAVIDAVGQACVAVKPQLACFERLGAAGWGALQVVVEQAHRAGLLVLADAKRGDIDVSAAAYGQALVGSTPTPFGDVPGLGADAFTASPYLGVDTLQVLVGAARGAGAGVFVLVRTSNPGAVDFEDLKLADGQRVWERVAAVVDSLGEPGRAGLADVGAVVGATAPEHLARMRELMPRAIFLLPGVGAQGGRVEDLGAAFAPGRAAGLVTASRSIVDAHERSGGTPASAARAEAERLRAAAWALS